MLQGSRRHRRHRDEEEDDERIELDEVHLFNMII
jgi:hypothetical protein